ncbi:MAG: neutral/alkaline non-lysosomal ceramidase N-terminal domain-containing protein [Pirellulales bacterium]|nr:neutral/alkaline non-lysosomal ceramidase N-terminal domain-containing protein [Pirellulales bacterium]
MRHARLLLGIWIVGTVVAAAPGAPPAAAEPTWLAGIAKAKITPEQPLWLAGYGARDRPAEGTLHDLWLKVLVLQTPDGQRAVVVTSDLLGFSQPMYEAVCAELKSQCGLDRHQIMLTASHTHSGPVLRDALYDIYPLDEGQVALIEAYSRRLEKTVVATVADALSQLTPAVLRTGKGSTNFGVNRRNNPQAQVDELLARSAELTGPVDHDVPVLAVRSPQGELRAVLFSYACHCTTLSEYEWSGDYAGFAQIALERSHPGAVAMFHAGCGADQNPLPRREVRLCQRYGDMLAAAVEATLRTPLRPVAPRLRTAGELIELPYEKTLDKPELEAALDKDVYQQRRARRLLRQLAEGKSLASGHHYPVQAWRLGEDQLWISLGGEVVVDYSLRFKQTYGATTWVTGYANDVMAYIPSRRVWEEGGYEAGAFHVYGLPTDRWTPDIEERIAGTVGRLVEQVK